MAEDYKSAAKDTVTDIKSRPRKAAVIFSLLGAAFAAFETNPSERAFKDICVENTNVLIQVPHYSRKPDAERYVNEVRWLKNQDRLEFHNFGICSIVLRRDFAEQCDLYEAQCKYLQPALEATHERLIDVGLFNHWIFLEKAMQDFDVAA